MLFLELFGSWIKTKEMAFEMILGHFYVIVGKNNI